MTKLDDDSQETYLALLLDAGCKFKYRTFIFNRPYVWMTDPQGFWFLERIPDYESESTSA